MGVDTAAADRLPWLADEPERYVDKPGPVGLLPWAALALSIVGAAGFWLGVRSVGQSPQPPATHEEARTTVHLPPAHPAVPSEVKMPTVREVRPTPAPDVRSSEPREVRIPVAPRFRNLAAAPSRPASEGQVDRTAPATPQPAPKSVAFPSPAPAAAVPEAFVTPVPWNPRQFAGAAGRLVQIGAFGSVTQAKHGWWFMVRAYPAMAHLPSVVRPTRNSKGRSFYRFQVGTTSQAHSEVLCQRMERISLSCAVVGLPWKAKVER